ncbi:MAG: type II toxin-antitoxin system RelE/ParE family toxin [Pseudomonadota bacterium]
MERIPLRIFKNREFSKFARKEKISDKKLIEAVENADSGLIDANYGGGVIKQRIARPNEGKSGGYRSIVLYRQGDKAFFVYGFAKNEQDNIDKTEESDFKKLAKIMFAMTDQQIDTLLDKESIEEVKP